MNLESIKISFIYIDCALNDNNVDIKDEQKPHQPLTPVPSTSNSSAASSPHVNVASQGANASNPGENDEERSRLARLSQLCQAALDQSDGPNATESTWSTSGCLSPSQPTHIHTSSPSYCFKFACLLAIFCCLPLSSEFLLFLKTLKKKWKRYQPIAQENVDFMVSPVSHFPYCLVLLHSCSWINKRKWKNKIHCVYHRARWSSAPWQV